MFSFQEVQFEILDLVDKVSDAMLHTMIAGQTPLVTRSTSVAVGLSKQGPNNVAGISVDVGGLGQFVMPRNVSLIDGTKNYSYVTTTVSHEILDSSSQLYFFKKRGTFNFPE